MNGRRFEFFAAVLALILPGLGYVALGQVRRAIYVGVGILGLIAGGVLIGGIDAIDSRSDPLWYGVQVLSGPTVVGLDYVHQHRFKVLDAKGNRVTPLPAPKGASSRSSYRPSLARVNDVGMLFVAVAGMLNLIAIIDCAWPEHHGEGGGGGGPSAGRRGPKVDRRRGSSSGVRIRRADGSTGGAA